MLCKALHCHLIPHTLASWLFLHKPSWLPPQGLCLPCALCQEHCSLTSVKSLNHIPMRPALITPLILFLTLTLPPLLWTAFFSKAFTSSSVTRHHFLIYHIYCLSRLFHQNPGPMRAGILVYFVHCSISRAKHSAWHIEFAETSAE